MMRECDKDDCEYETCVINERPRVIWKHTVECLESSPTREENPECLSDWDSRLAYRLGRM